jgi:hypothetical protein
MADKTIKVKVDVETDVQPSIAALKELKKQLRETAAGSEEFARLQQQINDTEDAIKSAKTGASNFTEILGELPGPIGEIGNKVSSTVNTLKQFGSLKLTDIKGSFVELGKDVLDVGKGIVKLTGIEKLYTITTVAMSKALKFVGIEATAASVGVKVFSAALISTGIGAIVVGLGMLISAFMSVGDEADTAADKVAVLNAELENGRRVAKLRANEEIAEAKARGASEAELYDIKQKNRQKDLDAARQAYKTNKGIMDAQEVLEKKGSEAYNQANKARAEAGKEIDQIKSDMRVAEFEEQERIRKANETAEKNAATAGAAAAAKRKGERDKEAADRKRTLDEITKNEKEAALSLLDERDQERRKIVNDYNAKIKLAEDNGKDSFILEEAKLKALADLNEKFRKEDADKKKEADEKEKERLKKIADEERELKFEGIQNQIDDITAKNELLENDFQEDIARLEQKKLLLEQQKEIELSNTDLTAAERLKIIRKYAKDEQDIDKSVTETKKAELEARAQLNLAYTNAVGALGSLLQQAAGDNKDLAIAGILIEQAAGIASIVINAKKNFVKDGGITSPLAWANAAAAAAAVIAAGLAAKKGIEQIKSTPIPGGRGGGSTGGSSAAPPSYAGAAVGMAAPQIQTTGGMNPTTQIAQTIGNAQAPIKAYVVSGEVSSQQALDRRTSRAATFS